MNHTYLEMWLAKYALTGGISKVKVRHSKDGWYWSEQHGRIFKLGRDIFELRDGALAHAEKMRAKKITSLQKQIDKLEAMKFEEPTP